MTTLDATAVEALGWALVHFAWQGALAGGLFAVLDLAAARCGRAPALRPGRVHPGRHGADAAAHRPDHARVAAREARAHPSSPWPPSRRV